MPVGCSKWACSAADVASARFARSAVAGDMHAITERENCLKNETGTSAFTSASATGAATHADSPQAALRVAPFLAGVASHAVLWMKIEYTKDANKTLLRHHSSSFTGRSAHIRVG